MPDHGDRVDLKALSPLELKDQIVEWGLPAFRAKQIYQWIHVRMARSFDAMHNLGKSTIAILTQHAYLSGLELEKVLTSQDGTQKLVMRTLDGHAIETVLIPAEGRLTQCISSQVGCRIGCTFCLTATMPIRRDLTPGEIVDQVYHARGILQDEGKRISNLVYMGMGEPLDNLESVIRSCERLMCSDGYGMSGRRITISTSGLANKMDELGERLPVHLALSLNASNDAVRDQVIPINRKFPIDHLLGAIRNWPRDRRQRVTVEYVLLGDTNDSPENAMELRDLLVGMEKDLRVNLIPFNPYPGALFERPDDRAVSIFGRALRDAGLRVTVRQSRGRDIGAACGMLDGEADSS